MNDDIHSRTILAIAGAVVATAAIAVTAATIAGAQEERPQQPVLSIEAAAKAPDGWRWESYRAVQLLVPAGWGTGGSPTQWCVSKSRNRPKPFVTRPGLSTMVLCSPELPDPAHRTSYVEFGGPATATKRFDQGWVRETRTFGGTRVTVLSDDAELRSRIFASARVTTSTDVFGCTPDHSSTTDPATRPDDEGGIESVGDVRSVEVCGYDLQAGRGPRLYTGRTFTGEQAEHFVEAIRNAPEGEGPDAAELCAPDSMGDRLYVLHVRGTEHDQDVIVRYSGCERNGTDDGTTRRRLTRDVFRTLYTGADRTGGTGVPEIGGWMAP